jgi:hypothetical protein
LYVRLRFKKTYETLVACIWVRSKKERKAHHLKLDPLWTTRCSVDLYKPFVQISHTERAQRSLATDN